MPVVYRYTDIDDGIVKYIGLSKEDSPKIRIQGHRRDKLCGGHWIIDYFLTETLGSADAWETHLINYYGTGQWFNTAKTDYGLVIEFIGREDEIQWIRYKGSSRRRIPAPLSSEEVAKRKIQSINALICREEENISMLQLMYPMSEAESAQSFCLNEFICINLRKIMRTRIIEVPKNVYDSAGAKVLLDEGPKGVHEWIWLNCVEDKFEKTGEGPH